MSEQSKTAGPQQAQQKQAQQSEMPFAMVHGEPVTAPPQDLYIPPDALEVFLEAFAGPLDLLLYLIKRQNLDILALPIANITQQYMDYIELMKELRLELAAEYLVMAAMLAEIKSRMLLPRPVEENQQEDPRAELIRRLQEYERFKKAAEDIGQLVRVERDFEDISVTQIEPAAEKKLPQVTIKDLIHALQQALARAQMYAHHEIQQEPLSIRERMTQILHHLNVDDFVEFTGLFTQQEGRSGVIVTFIAVLELLKEHVIEIVQSEIYAPIYIKPAGRVTEGSYNDAV